MDINACRSSLAFARIMDGLVGLEVCLLILFHECHQYADSVLTHAVFCSSTACDLKIQCLWSDSPTSAVRALIQGQQAARTRADTEQKYHAP